MSDFESIISLFVTPFLTNMRSEEDTRKIVDAYDTAICKGKNGTVIEA